MATEAKLIFLRVDGRIFAVCAVETRLSYGAREPAKLCAPRKHERRPLFRARNKQEQPCHLPPPPPPHWDEDIQFSSKASSVTPKIFWTSEFDHRAKPGDLIEIFRGSYEHWAVYVGGEEVVHLIPPQEESGASDLIKFLDSSTAQVRRQKLREVVGFHRFRINNLRDGECEPRERRAIVRDACAMVGRELPYCLATSNCEHFVTELRYGKPRSQQVSVRPVNRPLVRFVEQRRKEATEKSGAARDHGRPEQDQTLAPDRAGSKAGSVGANARPAEGSGPSLSGSVMLFKGLMEAAERERLIQILTPTARVTRWKAKARADGFISARTVRTVHVKSETCRVAQMSCHVTGGGGNRQVEAAAVMGGVATAGVALAVLGAALFASFSSKDDDNERSRRRRNR
ncbi:hypothetical protein F2P81_002981 [Scophthalmus maximus]|uniref:LRAT domain-containing protein n=1 Tax=Scophthalmus maximus TaxID=52904 RepID=A0A6A4TCV3_SCOMX|nr:hypothetical protein F2P81_002981 [Scophthalmus maximus]